MLVPETTAAAPEADRVSALTLRLFGPFEVRLYGQPLPRLRSRKGYWLLALLTLRHGCEVSRAWLAGTLWPDSTQEAAYASLRNSLKDLRRALGTEAGRLRSPTPRTLALDLEGVDADVIAFDRAIAQGGGEATPGRALASEGFRSPATGPDEEALKHAVDLYRGPLLEGCLEEWVLPERHIREQACLAALETLAARALERGDPSAAERHLRQAVTLEPLRETAQRALMQALTAGGNYAAAVQVYRELRLRLHCELNTAPDPETQALYQQLRTEARRKAEGGARSEARTGVRQEDGATERIELAPHVLAGLSPSPRLPLAPSLPAGTVTFLFTDIEGSSQLWEQDPEAMKSALQQHNLLLRQAIQAHGGLVFKTVGDAFYAAFATAPAAVAAALAAQRALQIERWGETGPLRVRMALHTGIAEAREGDYFGPTLNRLARILDVAHGGQVLLSLPTEELVRDALPEGASLRPLGEHRLRDLTRPEQLYQLLHPDLPSVFPPLHSLAAFTHNLPLQGTRFIGREREMEQVKQWLSTTPLLTLTGPGGCGKTRLALQVGADLLDAYPDGVWLVELAALAEPTLVPQMVAAALGVPEQPGRSLTTTLVEHLRTRALLLILDNCEHLLPACGALVDGLLRACPKVRILATSRERLGLTGERVYLVPPLFVPDPSQLPELSRLQQFEAVQLFVDRATLCQPAFAMTEANAPAVVQICQHLDGIPLAIELAAARVQALPVEKIAARLDDRFRLLTRGSRTALPRQQTLRALIDWSYDLLSESERRLLRRLSVFAGGWTLEAAERVCAGDGIEAWEVLDGLSQLVDKSLVVYEQQEGEARYRLLETIRQYSQAKLSESGEAEEIRQRHREWCLWLAEAAEPELQRSEQTRWLERLEMERDNLGTALEWSLRQPDLPETVGANTAVRLVGALWRFMYMRGHLNEGCMWLERALSQSTGEVTAARAKALHGAAVLWHERNDYSTARHFEEESLAIRRLLGDRQAIGESLDQLGHIVNAQGEHELATALFEESLALRRETQDRPGIAASLNALGYMALFRGDYERAMALCGESLSLRRELGDQWGVAYSLEFLSQAALEQGDSKRAAAWCQEALGLRRQLGDRRGIAAALENMGHIARHQEDWEGARHSYEESLQISEELGNTHGIAGCLGGMAGVALAQGDLARAKRFYRESLALWRETAQVASVLACLEALARVANGEGEARRAAQLLGAVEAVREVAQIPLPPRRRALEEHARAAVRSALGEAAFASAWSEGRSMSLGQAISVALEECEIPIPDRKGS